MKTDFLQGKKVTVMGLARSGRALVRVLSALGAQVTVSDRQTRDKLQPALQELQDLQFTLEAGGHTDKIYQGKDMVIISPGVPVNLPILNQARAAGVPVFGEVELAYRISPAPIIAVTGTNGKSTTTSLIYEFIRAEGKHAILAGNIGIPLCAEIYQTETADWVVAEISSFQLEAVQSFKPRIGVFLNITLDHMDRHRDFAEYLETKWRLFAHQEAEDFAVLNADDPQISRGAAGLKAQRRYFTMHPGSDATVRLSEDKLVLDAGAPEAVFNLRDIGLPGSHNLKNLMAAMLAAHCAGIRPEAMRQGLKAFKPLHHRMELAAVVNGVSYVDDSKGTNPDSVEAALNSYAVPVILIAGGKDKGMDFSSLAKAINRKVRLLLLIGESAPKIAAAVKALGFEAVMCVSSLEAAVLQAHKLARPGEVVLLSPACASFDMFNSAEERGDIFTTLVQRLRHEEES